MLSIGTDTLINTLQSAGGKFTAEQEIFFAKGGVSVAMLTAIHPPANLVSER